MSTRGMLLGKGTDRHMGACAGAAWGQLLCQSKDVDYELGGLEKVGFSVQLKIKLPLCISVATYLLSKRMKTKKQNLAPCALPGA